MELEEYNPKDFNDDELLDVFLNIDRDIAPDRYAQICQELDLKGIPYDDLSQGERNRIKHDHDKEQFNVLVNSGKDLFWVIAIIISIATFLINKFW